MIDYSNVKVGDTVWFTDVNRGGVTMTVVTKVGTKLITCGRMVFRKDGGNTNDAYGHQSLITDLVAYNAFRDACKAMSRLYYCMSGRPQEGVTVEDIQAAAKLLKINL